MYQKFIKDRLKGRKYDPRHIEGYMRLKYGTLDSLSPDQFDREVEFCIKVIDHDGKKNAERNALSYGL
jgi:hypothetical protein